MILVDRREGSKDYAKLLDDAILVELDAGDIAFTGNGPDGEVEIGVEIKKVNDLINSIMTGRLSGHQVPKLLESYYRAYIIVEGICKEDKEGGLNVIRGTRWKRMERGKRGIQYEGVCSYLTTLEEQAGIVVRTTADMAATATQITYLYNWWQKPYASHKALHQLYKRTPPTVSFVKPSLLRVIASDLPHVGYELSKEVERYFKTIERMMGASEEEWREIKGIGKGIAREVWEKLHEKR